MFSRPTKKQVASKRQFPGSAVRNWQMQPRRRCKIYADLYTRRNPDFTLPPESEPDDSHDKSVFIPWNAFLPTYRGKVKKDVDPLDIKNIKRFVYRTVAG